MTAVFDVAAAINNFLERLQMHCRFFRVVQKSNLLSQNSKTISNYYCSLNTEGITQTPNTSVKAVQEILSH